MELHKLVVVGIGGVGKSCLTIQYLKGNFVGQYDPTIEESYKKEVEIDGTECKLEILDTAGQEEYGAIRDKYIRAGEGFMCVYSVTSAPSISELKSFLKRIKRAKDSSKLPIVIIGNKADVDDDLRKVDYEDGAEFAKSHGYPFFETSAKTGDNVQEAFAELVRSCRSWKLTHGDSSDSSEAERRRKRRAARKKKNKKKNGGGCVLM